MPHHDSPAIHGIPGGGFERCESGLVALEAECARHSYNLCSLEVELLDSCKDSACSFPIICSSSIMKVSEHTLRTDLRVFVLPGFKPYFCLRPES